MTAQLKQTYIEEGVDALTLLTPLIEKRRQIILGVVLLTLAVGALAFSRPRKYKAELSLTPVVSSRSSSALGGIAALAGATLQTGYQLTPARMVELINSRVVLGGVGLSTVRPGVRIIDVVLDKTFKGDDADDVAHHLEKLLTTTTNKETGTIDVSIQHKDSALARLIAARVVDSASQIFVRTSRAQAQQLRIAQEARVENAKSALTNAEERLRQYKDQNRVTPAFSSAGLEQERLNRQIRFAEGVYNQAATDREAAYARELEATPTVVVQDPLPKELPKVRKRVLVKMAITAVVSFVLISFTVLLTDLTRRRLQRADPESARFQQAVSTLPGLSRRRTHPL